MSGPLGGSLQGAAKSSLQAPYGSNLLLGGVAPVVPFPLTFAAEYRSRWWSAKTVREEDKNVNNRVHTMLDQYGDPTGQLEHLVANRQPLLEPTGLNGKPVVTSDDGQRFFIASFDGDTTTGPAGEEGFTVAAVLSHGFISGGGKYFLDSFDAATKDLFRVFASTTTKLRVGFGKSGTTYSATSTTIPGAVTEYQLIIRCKNGTQEVFISALDDVMTPGSPTDSLSVVEDVNLTGTTQRVMSVNGSGSYWEGGGMSELLFINKYFTDAELLGMNAYFTEEWGGL